MLTISAKPLIKRIIHLAMRSRAALANRKMKVARQIPTVAQAQVALDDLQGGQVLRLYSGSLHLHIETGEGSTNTPGPDGWCSPGACCLSRYGMPTLQEAGVVGERFQRLQIRSRHAPVWRDRLIEQPERGGCHAIQRRRDALVTLVKRSARARELGEQLAAQPVACAPRTRLTCGCPPTARLAMRTLR